MANRQKEAIAVLVMLLIANVLLFFFQKPLSFNDGLGWDGDTYYSLANQFAHHQPIVGAAPYVYRIGTPFLVGVLFRDNLMGGFFAINLLASIAATLLLMVWLRLYIENWIIRCILIGMYMAHWLGPLRAAFFYPTQIEALPQVFAFLGLICVHLHQQKKSVKFLVLLSLVSSLGVLFRESLILIPLVDMLATWTKWYQNRNHPLKENWLSSIPFLVSLAIIILSKQFITPDNSYWLVGEVITWLYAKPLPSYFHAYFVAVGPILAVVACEWRDVQEFLKRYIFNLYYLAILCILSWVIGSDTDRFLFWAVPVWYVMIGIALQRLWPLLARFWPILVMILVFQGMTESVFRSIPDYAPEKIRYRIPLLSVICNDGCALDLPSYHGWSGSGIQTAGCSIEPCYLNGNIFLLRLYLLLENIIAALIITYSILWSKRRWNNRLNQPRPKPG